MKANQTYFKLSKHKHAISLVTSAYLILGTLQYCPVFTLHCTKNICKLPASYNTENTIASHREISRLTTDMNTIAGSGRPSRNSQGICNTSQHSIGYRTPTPQVHCLPRDRLNLSHHASVRMTGLLTYQVTHFNLVP